jgi:Ca-activated chloride channel family protein
MLHKGNLLESIESPSHQVRIENLKGDPVHVSLSSESVRMDRDFILYMDYGKSTVTRAYHYRTDKEIFVQLDFVPNGVSLEDQAKAAADSKGLKRELVFLVDCSGSMQGDSIGEAKKALEVCLRALEQGRRFNVYRFGSTHDSLFPEAKAYNERTAEEALLYVKTMDADLGGTEILKPLKQICSSKRKVHDPEMDIVLLTDGQVGNESEILKLIRKNSAVVRVFPVGIGAGCNEYFIKGLARAGGGVSEFIFPGERIEPKVLGVFGKLNEEVVTDLDISWGASPVEQAPASAAVFTNSAATFFARIPGGSVGKRELKVKGKVDGRKKVWEVEVVDLDEQSLPIPTLWARERIRDLEESDDALLSGSRQRERKMGQVNARVVEISKNYGLLSQLTSYVAIEQREERDKTTGEVTLRKIPVLLPIGWHGMGSLQKRAYAPRNVMLSIGRHYGGGEALLAEADEKLCLSLEDREVYAALAPDPLSASVRRSRLKSFI